MDERPDAAVSSFSEVQINRNFKQKIKNLVSNITVEPLVVLYFTSVSLTPFATANLNLEKACRVNLEYNTSVCDAITARNVTGLEEEEIKIQTVVVSIESWRDSLRYSLPAIFIIFIGAWSDRTSKRKPLLLLPLLGELLTSIGLLLCTYYYLEWPVEVAGVIECLFPLITGGNMVFFLALFSYISDITAVEERTFRIGIINMLAFLCASVAGFIGGVLLEKITFYGIFSIAAISYIFGLIYCWFLVKEIQKDAITSPEPNEKNCFFDLGLVKETFFILFKRRENHQRLVLWLLMCAFITIVGPPFAESRLAYIFMRAQFQWDEKYASYLSTYSTIITFIGTLLAVSVLSKILKLNDCLIGLIVSISRLMAGFCYAFSYKGWQLYVATTIDLLVGSGSIPVRSIVSKIVPSNEIGKTFSLMGICEGVAALTFVQLYSKTYQKTLDTFRGAIFLLGVIFALIAGSIFMAIYVMFKRGVTLWDERPVQLDAAKNDQTTKEHHLNEAFETEEPEAIESKL